MAKIFKTIGKTIYYDGIEFATIDGKAWPWLEAEALDLLDTIEENSDLAYTQAELDEAYTDGYKEAEESFRRDIERLEDRVEELKAELENAK
jgi:flagellar biosynthesis/type III secretory pathway protein FliH